jgi:hypothetical protein
VFYRYLIHYSIIISSKFLEILVGVRHVTKTGVWASFPISFLVYLTVLSVVHVCD